MLLRLFPIYLFWWATTFWCSPAFRRFTADEWLINAQTPVFARRKPLALRKNCYENTLSRIPCSGVHLLKRRDKSVSVPVVPWPVLPTRRFASSSRSTTVPAPNRVQFEPGRMIWAVPTRLENVRSQPSENSSVLLWFSLSLVRFFFSFFYIWFAFGKWLWIIACRCEWLLLDTYTFCWR